MLTNETDFNLYHYVYIKEWPFVFDLHVFVSLFNVKMLTNFIFAFKQQNKVIFLTNYY